MNHLVKRGLPAMITRSYSKKTYPKTLSLGKRRKRKTVLITGEPGIGKTTICKNVAWDWAKGFLTVLTIVFFVSMQLINPGDSIEEIIIQQNPELEGLKISEKKLKHFLESFGDQCLLILDDYDEFVAENKENVDSNRVLEGRKFLAM